MRAPTLLRDYHAIENAIGDQLPPGAVLLPRRLSDQVASWFYRFALERGYFDAMLDHFVVRPFVRVFQWCDRLERRWTNLLSGGPSRDLERPPTAGGGLDDLL